MKRKAIAVLTALLLLAASANSAEPEPVYFLHITDNTLKMGCVREVREEGNAAPRYSYTCPDEQGKVQPVQPDEEWRLMETKKVCFLDRVRDSIRVCTEIGDPQEPSRISYACTVGDGPPKLFEPTRKWEKLREDDSRCTPRPQSFIVPDGTVIPTIPDVRGENGTGK
ncbi:MAG: hypothetical protein ACL93V_00185 [Candidatus Electrothrix sp. YB6]